mgnify:CR=1 FL=1
MNTVFQLQREVVVNGRLLSRSLPAFPGFRYLLRLSSRPDPKRVLVVVHGISRRPAYMLRCLEAYADAFNYTLVAPVFNRWLYRDYQRLGRPGRGARADLAFAAMLDDLSAHTGLNEPVHLMGFSGGAQFAHRYVYSRSQTVRSLCLAAAGWYTAPDAQRAYPYGTFAVGDLLPGSCFSVEGLLRTPTLTLIGEKDIKPDSAMRSVAGLNQRQGQNRMERAVWFHNCLECLAKEYNAGVAHGFQVLPDTGHSFKDAVWKGGLAGYLFNFCEKVCNESSDSDL